MQNISFEEYKSVVPEETRNFIEILLGMMSYDDVDYLDIYNRNFFYTLKAYQDISGDNKGFLSSIGFDQKDYLDRYIETSEMEDIFYNYYNLFVNKTDKTELMLTTAEDIIYNFYKELTGKDRNPDVFRYIDTTPESFMNNIKKLGDAKKQLYLRKMNNYFNEDYSISVINYFETAGKILVYLKNKIAEDEVVDSTELKYMALVLAIYYYKDLVPKNVESEKDFIIDYLSEKGLNKEKMENKCDIWIDEDELKNIDSTPALVRYYSDIKPEEMDKKDVTVARILKELFSNENDKDNLYVKRILGKCEVDIESLSDFSKEINKFEEQNISFDAESTFADLKPSFVEYLKRWAKYYTYLEDNKDKISDNIMLNDNDLIGLTFLLSQYEFENEYNAFFIDKKVTLEAVLKFLGLPEKEEFLKELENTQTKEQKISKISSLVYYLKQSNPKDLESALNYYYDNNNCQIIRIIYEEITSEELEDNIKNEINTYTYNKEQKRKSELEEKLLADISIDVYNYLSVLYSYYIRIKEETELSQVDNEQLAIILSASKYDKKIEKYLDSMGMYRNQIARAFNYYYDEDYYKDLEMDIDVIDKVFRPYIFDRESEKITVYSIFENAFNPELKNSLVLRRALFSFNKKCTDFTNIEDRIKKAEEDEKQKYYELKVDSLYSSCTTEGRYIINTVIKIHEYISIHMKELNLVKDQKDIEELSVLLVLLHSDEDYIKHFANNGITLEQTLKIIGLPEDLFVQIKDIEVNKLRILDYEKYIRRSDYNFERNALIEALLNDYVNDSQLLEKLTEITGNNYRFLVEEVRTKKERELTPQESYIVLTNEQVEVIPKSDISEIASYGTTISKHSRYINDALQKLVRSDNIDNSIQEINNLLEQVEYEEPVPKKQSFLSLLFALEEQQEVVKKYDSSKIGEIQIQVEKQISVLVAELKSYEFVKKYIEIYLRKIEDYLKQLKTYRNDLDSEVLVDSTDEIEAFTQSLNRSSARSIIESKISTFETIKTIMKQELAMVHQAITNHFITINALEISRSAIIPLIATEFVISKGQETESEALELTSNLIGLLGGVINRNVEATRDNLKKLEITTLDDSTYESLSNEVYSYLEKLESSGLAIESKEEMNPDSKKTF